MLFRNVIIFFLGTLSQNVLGEKIVLAGSDTLGSKMVIQLKEAYVAESGNKASVDFEIISEGSSQAFSSLLAGTADIGMSSRAVRKSEKLRFDAKDKNLVEHEAGLGMIGVIVNGQNGLRSLTLKQIEEIFTGDISDWIEVGGKSGKISVYGRSSISGTSMIFQNVALGSRDYGEAVQKLSGNEQVAKEVAKNVNGIGFVGMSFSKKKGLRVLKIDGVQAGLSNTSDYPLTRKLYFYTVGEASGEAGRFLKWAKTSEKAKAIIHELRFISVDE